MEKSDIAQYQREFAYFLVQSEALVLENLPLKSGRIAPYYVNTGKFDSGDKISKLGYFYASHIAQLAIEQPNVIFGPAYKGVPLAVATSTALANKLGKDIYYTFDPKEAKDHGDAGMLAGHVLKDGDRVLLVEDVVTAGTTLRSVVPLIKSIAAVNLIGVVIAVDRCEKGSSNLSAVQEAKQTLGISVFPILTIHQLIECLSTENPSGTVLKQSQLQKIADYLKEYGV